MKGRGLANKMCIRDREARREQEGRGGAQPPPPCGGTGGRGPAVPHRVEAADDLVAGVQAEGVPQDGEGKEQRPEAEQRQAAGVEDAEENRRAPEGERQQPGKRAYGAEDSFHRGLL